LCPKEKEKEPRRKGRDIRSEDDEAKGALAENRTKGRGTWPGERGNCDACLGAGTELLISMHSL
jgi:hypothetical protein